MGFRGPAVGPELDRLVTAVTRRVLLAPETSHLIQALKTMLVNAKQDIDASLGNVSGEEANPFGVPSAAPDQLALSSSRERNSMMQSVAYVCDQGPNMQLSRLFNQTEFTL